MTQSFEWMKLLLWIMIADHLAPLMGDLYSHRGNNKGKRQRGIQRARHNRISLPPFFFFLLRTPDIFHRNYFWLIFSLVNIAALWRDFFLVLFCFVQAPQTELVLAR